MGTIREEIEKLRLKEEEWEGGRIELLTHNKVVDAALCLLDEWELVGRGYCALEVPRLMFPLLEGNIVTNVILKSGEEYTIYRKRPQGDSMVHHPNTGKEKEG